jgi:acetyltransferase-like isoleucine patch superfamily enzyme
MIHLLFKTESVIKNNLFKFKGYLLKFYFASHGCKVGKKLRCHTFPRFRIPPHKNYLIGDNVTIGYDITFEIFRSGSLSVGDFVKFTQNILISSGCEIRIGEYTLFGENVSIRDGDHNSFVGEPITFQSSTYLPVYIGKDVWIGAGCFILKGSNIPDGVIVGANSVVLKSAQLENNCIYAGSPARKIGTR